MNQEQERAWFGQESCRCRLEWGRRGAQSAAERGDILVVIDVLSFSTAVAAAVDRGAIIYPCGKEDDAGALARHWGAVAAVRREEALAPGIYSLSPETFRSASPGERIVLPSPNGATCSLYGSRVPLLAGALVNAAAVASVVAEEASRSKLSITVLACGERWHSPHEEGELRFALEDYLGAGAVLAYLPSTFSRSPEATVCEAAFAAAADRLPQILRDCGSGVELRRRGYPKDVDYAAGLNSIGAVPLLRDGIYFSGRNAKL